MADSLDVLKWIIFAQNDFDVASREAGRFRPLVEVVCYHCQQSAEKILKAYTIAKTNILTKTHILGDLLNDCEQHASDFNNFRSICSRLTPHITLGRYPADIEPTEYHMKQALKDAAEILEFTKLKLKELGYEYVPEQAK
jgi:HEPN domain-containing protein